MDLSLDDVISRTGTGRGSRGGTRGRGGRGARRGTGSTRRGRGSFPRASRVPDGVWEHDRYEDAGFQNGGATGFRATGRTSLGSTQKILISNLDFNVSDSDVEELFGEFGALHRASIHYDNAGRSLGSGEVVFARRADAQKAIKQYNNVPLDGRPMKIQMIGPGSENQSADSLTAKARLGVPRGRGGGGGSTMRGSGGGRGGRSRGGRRGGSQSDGPKPTADELDAELEAYIKKG